VPEDKRCRKDVGDNEQQDEGREGRERIVLDLEVLHVKPFTGLCSPANSIRPL